MNLINDPDEERLFETASPPGQRRMCRRDLLVGGVKVSLAFLASDAFGLPAISPTQDHGPRDSGRQEAFRITQPPTNLDDSLNILAAYLVKYKPPDGTLPLTGAWRATYDVLQWMGSANVPMDRYFRANQVIGHLAISRESSIHDTEIAYDIEYRINLHGFVSTLKSRMKCSGGAFPGLLDWQTDYEKLAAGSLGVAEGLSERGSCSNGKLEVVSPAGRRSLQTDRPVMPQWVIMDTLRRAKPTALDPITRTEFDLLYDLTSYRSRQRLTYCGVLKMTFEGTACVLHGFVQTGIGTQPTHHWIDSAGRPLLSTGGLISTAATSFNELRL